MQKHCKSAHPSLWQLVRCSAIPKLEKMNTIFQICNFELFEHRLSWHIYLDLSIASLTRNFWRLVVNLC